MRTWVVIAVASCLACNKPSTTLPQDYAGSYTHTTSSQFGLSNEQVTDELTVSTSGMSVKSSDPMKMSVQAGGPLGVTMGAGGATSDLFTEVKCEGSNCQFKTKAACQGSIDRAADGTLTIVASGLCSAWSGSWKRSL